MFSKLLGATLALGLSAGLVTGAAAAPITEYSGDGGDVLVSSVNPGAVTSVTPHPSWGDVSDNAGLAANTASWISYDTTGFGEGVIAPNSVGPRIVGNETAHFQRTFSTTGGSFTLWVLSDDTATVTLDGGVLFGAFAGQIDPCAPGGTGVPIGCVEADMGVYSTVLAAGTYTLDFYSFQTNFDVFGTQYAFTYEQAEQVPEPEILAMVGAGLVGLGAAIRRRRRNEG